MESNRVDLSFNKTVLTYNGQIVWPESTYDYQNNLIDFFISRFHVNVNGYDDWMLTWVLYPQDFMRTYICCKHN